MRFEPNAAIYSDEGELIATAGAWVTLSQTAASDAAGTFDDPYLAAGLVFGGCYPPQR